MEFQSCFPIWDNLTADQQGRILDSLAFRRIQKGTVIHNGSADCAGLLVVKSGQLRAYILSDEGREITVYRLFDRDICLFSASCILRSAQFDITIEAEKDTDLWVIPPEVYRGVMEASAPAANYTNEIMAARFSEVMWLGEQILSWIEESWPGARRFRLEVTQVNQRATHLYQKMGYQFLRYNQMVLDKAESR